MGDGRSIQRHRLYAAYHLIALRGLRRGEAAGLRWCDVDLDGKTAVDHPRVAALRAHRDRQRAEAASFGPGYRASGYVFTNLNGGPMAPDRFTRTSRPWPRRPGCRRCGCTISGTARPRWP